MTEPGEQETRRALRAMLAERIGAPTPPSGLYETVRRQHRRRQRAVVSGAAVLAAAAVAVPAVALAGRPGTAPAVPAPTAGAPADRRCTFPGEEPAPRSDRLPAQRDVPGSLGGDADVVDAVLRAGWSALRAEDPEARLDPATARVRLAERVEG
ncbi:MAG TPA: hypothetical protein VE547_22010, partial [Mycobacteriales bacterium]|nr:hypothetical protein [Mycobacteriales bacterium]